MAVAFARKGAKAVIADMSTAGGEETVQVLKERGGDGCFIRADVTEAKFPHMLKQVGGASANALSMSGLIGDPEDPAYSASQHGVVGLTRTAALGCTKHGIRVNAVASVWIQTPFNDGYFADSQKEQAIAATVPLNRLGQLHEVAEAVVWVCSDAAAYVTGHVLVVDGGKCPGERCSTPPTWHLPTICCGSTIYGGGSRCDHRPRRPTQLPKSLLFKPFPSPSRVV
jgi:NAD(P)-dependent dehydrogenase (short-subunit alcohol dehydrogenase family)